MNAAELLGLFGLDEPAATPKPKGTKGSPSAAPATRRPRRNTPHIVPCVIFHPEALTVKQAEIDIANGESGNQWFPTEHGSLVCTSFIGHPDVGEALQACIEEIALIRARANQAESKAVGKMFALARMSREGLLGQKEEGK